MLRIAHLADVHVRGLSRHSEYRDVSLAFAESARAAAVDHIFVAGDLFHTKTTGISPEYIDFMSWWLTLLSDVAELHIMLGNHDGNLVNASRQDAVSPIVTALKNDRIHVYKASGVYEFAPGYNWCVFSLFDVDGWERVKPVPGKVNIACYHGPIVSALTETGWSVDDGLSMERFRDYDFVFLGDIHKTQFLEKRSVELVIDADHLSAHPDAEVIEEI